MIKFAFTVRLLCFLLLLGGVKVSGQEIVTGMVVDSASLNPLPSANILIKNSSRGTTTNERGNFSIEATRNDTLVFTLVGYQTLELPLSLYEAGMIRLTERYTLLQAVTINEFRQRDLYEGMFDDQNAKRKRSIPFYLSKAKKEKIKIEVLRTENLRVKTYVEVVVNNQELKNSLMKKYALSEREYYDILTLFNEHHHEVMYYLTRAELISMLNTFFDNMAPSR